MQAYKALLSHSVIYQQRMPPMPFVVYFTSLAQLARSQEQADHTRVKLVITAQTALLPRALAKAGAALPRTLPPALSPSDVSTASTT
jgi:hypothetical protein